ncbi:MAG: hypothetical protein WCP93_00040 [Candidatus Berkelbacteria bacterium]
MKAYLDIDGVILANDKQVANHAVEFIKYLVGNHDVYWLTTHCSRDDNYTIELLSRFFDSEMIEIIKKIKPLNWDTWKTEAIDFDSDFLWFDDEVFEEEKRILRLNDKYDSWVEIDLSKNPDQLKDLIK